MCTTCGCGHGETRSTALRQSTSCRTRTRHEAWPTSMRWLRHRTADATATASHADGTWHRHDRRRPRRALPGRSAPCTGRACRRARSCRSSATSSPRTTPSPRRTGRRSRERGIFALNLVSSPGSGKTTLLVRTIEALHGRMPVAVIEGDQQTSRDADRIRATGAPAVQINTGKGCHLDAQMVGARARALSLARRQPAADRERRQSRLPRRVRSRRGAQGRRSCR